MKIAIAILAALTLIAVIRERAMRTEGLSAPATHIRSNAPSPAAGQGGGVFRPALRTQR